MAEERDTSTLTVLDVDITTDFEKDSRTSKYHINEKGDGVVVRRGNIITISIKCHRELQGFEEDSFNLVFLAENNPSRREDTRVELNPASAGASKGWEIRSTGKDVSTVNITLYISHTCPVGVWKLNLEPNTDLFQKNMATKYSHKKPIFILFNPWCMNDLVHFPEQRLLNEYILNDIGTIYMENKNNIISGMKWNFGQFEENILDCAMYLLDTYMSWPERGDPTKVSRILSEFVNNKNDTGILEGQWGREIKDYEDGNSPNTWMGSVAILNEYYKTKMPVRYGQCWVFSGITTTLCRSLGIPARSVTNFESAHCIEGSLSINLIWTKDGLTDKGDGSIWNFHVWNDVWMKRPDINDGPGWQAIDATPQEPSDGKFRCGPASHSAIKSGNIGQNYDSKFVFTEVKAEIRHWMKHTLADGGLDEKTLIKIDRTQIGKNISTKKPYSEERNDITTEYKPLTETPEEQNAVENAMREANWTHLEYDEDPKMDVEFTMNELQSVQYGEHFDIILTIQNKIEEDQTVTGCLRTSSIYYNGKQGKVVKEQKINEIVKKEDTGKDIRLTVKFDDYYRMVVEQYHIMVSCICEIQGTKQPYVNHYTFCLTKPTLDVKVTHEKKVEGYLSAKVTFVNPLPIPLTKCVLTAEGPGLEQSTEVHQSQLSSQENFNATIWFKMKSKRETELIVLFNSRELQMVEGSCKITAS